MDINKCADCYTVYCSFSESDRQKLEMFDEMVNVLIEAKKDFMTSIPAKTYSEQEVEDMLRTLGL